MKYVATIVMLAVLAGCGAGGKKFEDGKSTSDLARKTSASGNWKMEASSEDPAAKAKLTVDGMEYEGPASKLTVEAGFDTAEKLREKDTNDVHTEFFKQTSLGLKILAAVLIVAGLILAIKFSPVLGLSVAGVGGMLLALELYPWLLFIVLGAVALGAAYLIYEKYATESQKSEAEQKIAKLKDALRAVVLSLEQSADGIKEAATSKISENTNDPSAVKDTITEIKRET